MYVSFQLPITDLRPFILANHGRLTRPAWPYAQEGRDYIRSFGQVRRRWRGGIIEWDGEQRYCIADHAIKISSYEYLRNEKLRLLHRRLYRVDDHASRLEVAFRPFGNRDIIKNLDAILAVQIATPSRATSVPLVYAEKAVVLQYLLSTTKRISGKPHPHQTWWVTPGAKQVIVEYSRVQAFSWSMTETITKFPEHTVLVAEFDDIRVHHCWLSCQNQPISIWFLGGGRNLSRRYRLNIARIHNEYESLKCVLRRIAEGKLSVNTHTDLADALTKYLRASIRFLLRPPKNAIGDSSPLVQVLGMAELVLPGERESLLRNLRGLRPNIVKMIEDITAPGRLKYAGLRVFTNAAYFGSTTVNDQSVKISGTNITVGNVTVASTIQGSFNHVEKSAAQPELKTLLESLHTDIAKMVNRLPPETSESVARDLQTFSAEAVSAKPRKNFLQVTAGGLIEAAKTVAEFTAPVVTAVKAILTIFGL